jgi:hypothetical protein
VDVRPRCESARGPYHGLFLELKRIKGGVVSPEQDRWHAELRAQGYRVEVCKGAEAAWTVLLDYCGLARHTPYAPMDVPLGAMSPVPAPPEVGG